MTDIYIDTCGVEYYKKSLAINATDVTRQNIPMSLTGQFVSKAKAYNPKVSKRYINGKYRMLKEFRITITSEIKNRMEGASTEVEVDNIVKSLILNR